MKEIWGIYIRKPDPISNPETKYGNLEYVFTIGRFDPAYDKSKLAFVTSDLISGAIKSFGLRKNEKMKIGYIKYAFEGPEGMVYSTKYYPKNDLFHPPFFWSEKLEKTGLASLIELQVVKDLERRFPGFHIRSGMVVSDSRVQQLHKQGRYAHERMPLWAAKEKLRDYVVRQYKARRAQARRKPR